MNGPAPILVALTARGAALARRLQSVLPGARVHGLAARVSDADQRFDNVVRHLQALFADRRPIVAVAAAGIVVRALAPCLGDKRREPPVVALAEDGSVAVPLLGGHRGANALARTIAEALGGVAALTTAGEVSLGLALDQPPAGWRILDPAPVKRIAAALLAGEKVALRIEAGEASWLVESGLVFSDRAPIAIRVTDRAVDSGSDTLVYHPPVLALGVGAERGVAAAELVALVRRTLAQAKLAPAAIACVASHEMKSDEPAIHALATELGVPARFFSSATLAAEESRLARPSELVRRLAGTPGVAEAAALAAAGPGGALIVPKTKSARATCALARSLTAIDPATLGIARGSLSVVGIGPGDPAWRTTEASAAIVAAQDVVGYGLYLDLIADLIAGKSRHESGLGHEEDRVRLALDLAVSGRRVALVSSGDAGIYGLAALAVELIERADDPAWARIDLRVCPGVSALQAAAARVGAPLGHDFCAISLSDLLTPWAEIERRLAAAGAGDFVVALYNPVSMRRRWQLARACEILARHRPTETPVVLARNLGRDGERVEIIKLCDLAAASVDMLTVVLVGSSRTRVVARPSGPLVVTPRGYAAKTIRAKRARDS